MVLCVVAEKPRISCIISTYSDIEFVEKKISEIQKQTIFEEAEFILLEEAKKEPELFEEIKGEI